MTSDRGTDSPTHSLPAAAHACDFGNGFRAEIEGSYRNNSVDKFTSNNIGGFSAPHSGGTEQKYGVMVNALRETHPAEAAITQAITVLSRALAA